MLLVLSLHLFSPAHAQSSGVDGHGFAPAPLDRDLRDPILVQRPGAFHQGDVFLGTLFELAERPVIDVYGPQLDDLFALNTSLGFAVHDRLRLSAALPFYFQSIGPGGVQSSAFGDTRLEIFASLLAPEHVLEGGGPGLGVGGALDLPTGPEDQLLGLPGVAGTLFTAATYELDVLTVSADLGLRLAPTVEGLTGYQGGTALSTGLAVGTLYSNWSSISAELRALSPLGGTSAYTGRGMPAETVFSHRLQPREGFHLIAGAAAGLTDAPGSAAWRVFAGLGAANMIGPRRDADPIGELLVADNCPTEPETHNGWLDEDGCPDDLSSLAVIVVHAGAPVPGAEVELTGPEGTETHVVGEAPINIPQAAPESRWTAVARAGGCLEGEASAVASAGGTELVVQLQRYDAQVRVEAVDPDGAYIPEASVDWTGADVRCSPSPPLWRMPEGVQSGTVGAGPHQLVVKAPGYSLSEHRIELSAGDSKTVRAELVPTLVRVEAKRITIMDKIHFETGKAVIKPESYGLLDEVARIIMDNPQVGRVEIAGHTDNRGSDELNLDLSTQRAQAVRDFLLEAGVSSQRLVARGYGETRPIDTNITRDGRANNRRVEFNLIDQAEEGPP